MPTEITKAEFMRLLGANLIEWPPVKFQGRVYGKKLECEDTAADFVYFIDV